MDNPELGRKVLNYITEHPEQFNMEIWGTESPSCGTVACLAGWALLLSGCKVDARERFTYEDGEPVSNIGSAARKLLRLTEDEYFGGDDAETTLFGEQPEEDAIERFRAIVEASEDAKAGQPS